MSEFKQNNLERQQTSLVITKAKQLPHGQFEAILSTDDLDRHGEHVSIKGIEIPKQIIKMYYNHETSGANLPIGKWLKVWKKDGKLWGHGEIDLEDDFAVKVYKKVLKGIIDSISIGFYPKEYDGETSTWTLSTLVEASVVAEPANVNAVITSKELGFSKEEFNTELKEKIAKAKEELFPDQAGTPPQEVVSDPATYNLTPPKQDEPAVTDTQDKQISVKRIVKGAVQDVLLTPKKWELMRDFYDIMYAFEEAYYNEDTEAADFNKLLTECISLLQSVVDGTYKQKNQGSDASGTTSNAELKTAIDVLKSKLGAVEATLNASTETPAIKQLIRVRIASKQVDKAAENLNRVIKVKLKETQ